MNAYRRAAVVIAVLVSTVARAQDNDPVTVGPDILRAISPLLIPKAIGDCALLRDYIRSEEFAQLRKSCGDLWCVNAIYLEALRLSWNSRSEALLISAFASFDHRRVGVRLPLVGPLLWLPLTSEFEEEFDDRLKALPSKLYPDTPPGAAGDRDKLEHFFGSAFLAYTLDANDPAERVGDFVEWGEERFIVGGVNDERDKRSNAHGRRFGLSLRNDDTVLPSDFMLLNIVRWKARTGCVPDSVFPVMEVQ